MIVSSGDHGQVASSCADLCPQMLAAALLAIAGNGLGGVAVVAAQGAAFEAWLAALSEARPDCAKPLRLPPSIAMDNLEGGTDYMTSLATGRAARRAGVLDALGGRAILLTGAERWSAAAAARLLAICDRRDVPLLLVLDESAPGDEPMPAMLADRLALRIALDGVRAADLATDAAWSRRVAAASARFDRVVMPEEVSAALVSAAVAFGIASLRADGFAAATARAHAAWRGADVVGPEDAEVAARMVLAHRARHLPSVDMVPDETEGVRDEMEPPAGGDTGAATPTARESSTETAGEFEDRLISSAVAVLPSGLLAANRKDGALQRVGAAAGGRARETRRRSRHGRPIGSARGDPRRDGPLDLLATITAAAPWQTLRRRALMQHGRPARAAARPLIVLPGDIRVTRFRSRAPATTVFAIDASGSSALHRMAEAKGAIEALLAECYVRREKVAVVAFRGARAELVLPPTRALARARRALSGLPGGGATPLASGIDAARAVALAARRMGEAVLVVLLTDGRANIDRSGAADRRRAAEDAGDAARRLAADAVPALLIDTSPAPSSRPAELARNMRARYIPLPHAGAEEIAAVVLDAGASPR